MFLNVALHTARAALRVVRFLGVLQLVQYRRMCGGFSLSFFWKRQGCLLFPQMLHVISIFSGVRPYYPSLHAHRSALPQLPCRPLKFGR